MSSEPIASLVVPPELRRTLGVLALALNHTLEEPQVRAMAYTLRDLDVALLSRACAEVAKTALFWPKVAEIREAYVRLERAEAEASADRALAALPPMDPSDWRSWYACHDCQDTSFVLLECNGLVDDDRAARCGRPREHEAHRFAVRCACYLTNPRLRAERARTRVSRP